MKKMTSRILALLLALLTAAAYLPPAALAEEVQPAPSVTAGDQGYATIAAALEAGAEKIAVNAEKLTENVAIPAGKTVTLTIPAGKTLTSASGYTIENKGTLTVTGGGTVTGEAQTPVIRNLGAMTLENITVKQTHSAAAIHSGDTGEASEAPAPTLTIKSGTYSAGTVLENSGAGAVKISGGIFTAAPPADYLVKDHICVEKEGLFEVVQDRNGDAIPDRDQTFCTVTYRDGAEGAAFADQTSSGILAGSATPAFDGTPTREGYTFQSWDPVPSETVTEDIIYTAQWTKVEETPETFTVTYIANAGEDEVAGIPAAQTVAEGAEVALPAEAPVREGYDFAAWTTEDVELKDGKFTMPAKDVTLTATWQEKEEPPVTHTVTYIANAGEDEVAGIPATQTVAEGAEVALPAEAPAREGYDFAAWTTEDVEVKDGKFTMPAKDVTLTATWQKKEEPPKTYTITYKDGLGEDRVYTVTGEGQPTPRYQNAQGEEKDPVREGYHFLGWKPSLAETVTANATYTAQWTNEKFDVIYDASNKGLAVTGAPENAFVFYGSTQTVTTTVPVCDQYLFAGWSARLGEGEKTYKAGDTFTMPHKKVTFTAIWKEDLNRDGIADETQSRYTVKYTDGVKNKIIFEDLVWTVIGDGQPTPPFQNADGSYKAPVRENYVFTGWTPEVAKTVTADAVYTATWKADKNANGIPDENEVEYRTVRVVWKSDTEKTRPSSVTVQLTKDGTAYGDPVKLTAENKWTHKWTYLENGAEYKVVELVVPKGYKVSYSYTKTTMTITNKRSVTPYTSSGKPLQTGQLNWPIPVLVVCGIAAVSGGLVLIVRRKRGEYEQE